MKNRINKLLVACAVGMLPAFAAAKTSEAGQVRKMIDKVNLHWVKGHASTVENNRCDVLAVAAANGTALAEDTGYDPDNA